MTSPKKQPQEDEVFIWVLYIALMFSGTGLMAEIYAIGREIAMICTRK